MYVYVELYQIHFVHYFFGETHFSTDGNGIFIKVTHWICLQNALTTVLSAYRELPSIYLWFWGGGNNKTASLTEYTNNDTELWQIIFQLFNTCLRCSRKMLQENLPLLEYLMTIKCLSATYKLTIGPLQLLQTTTKIIGLGKWTDSRWINFIAWFVRDYA